MKTLGRSIRRPSAISVANELVSIIQVCRWLGVDVPEDVAYGRSVKVRCPFGEFYHSDGGIEASMRLYPDTNHAYCFSCAYHYSPVSLAARAWDQRYQTAAATLLEKVGHKPVSLAQAWSEVVDQVVPPNRDSLAAALTTYCLRIDPGWAEHQFTAPVAAVLDKCLALLASVDTDDQATHWLDVCKLVMRRALDDSVHNGGTA